MPSSTIDVRDMAIVHKTFRTTYAESAGLVADSADAPGRRVAFLADHIDFTLTLLHLHHGGEDAVLWPLLIERAPDEASMVQRVADQHHDVSSGIERVGVANRAWRDAPSADTRAALTGTLNELSAVLNHHLDDEEQLVVPLAARTMTQAEWNSLGEHARAGIPQDKMFVAFGLLLDPLTREERDVLFAEVPEPVQQLWASIGEQTWKTYATELRDA